MNVFKRTIAALQSLNRRLQSPQRRPDEGLVKVQVRLVGAARESGYETESLWAEPLGNNRYLIWNVPLLAYNLDMRAIVECAPDPDGGLPIVTHVVRPGDCFGVRLYFSKSATDSDIESVLNVLAQRHPVMEKGSRLLWAVGFRSLADHNWAGPALRAFIERGIVHIESTAQADQPEIGSTA